MLRWRARSLASEYINIDVFGFVIFRLFEFTYFYFVQCHCPLVQINPKKNFSPKKKKRIEPKVPKAGEFKKRMKKKNSLGFIFVAIFMHGSNVKY